MNTIIYVLKVFVYGFIVLITMITIANIINTISTGIALRRKEFAMLKSVGTTPKGFTKMISLESAFYGMKAVIFGIPISLLISFAINKALGENTIPFEINWLLYIAVILIVFAIVGMSMFYSVSKLKDDSIIETLKEDIL
jgi:putative ABC transport system permease protein